MKFSEEQIEQAREVPIQKLIGKDVGRRVTISCPFHSENTPSCVIYPDGDYNCFGCDANGQNAVDFLMAMGSSFTEVIEELLKYK
jgi:DNA primase